MAITRLELNMDQEPDGYSFRVANLAENCKKKKQRLRVSCLQAGQEKIIVVAQNARSREYCDDAGNFRYFINAKVDLFSMKEYQFFIPFKLFDWMECGQLVSVRVERLEDNDEVTGRGQIDMMVNSGNRLTRYTVSKYVQYLNHYGKTAEKFAFAGRYVQNPDAANAEQVVEMLRFLAEQGQDGQAEYLLYHLFINDAFAQKNEKDAHIWLSAAAQKHHVEACREIGEIAVVPEVTGEDSDPDSMDVVIASANSGNREAQYKLYGFYLNKDGDPDPAKAVEWLERAVENGHDEAVKKLEAYYLETYLVDANVGHFMELVGKAARAGSTAAYYMLFEVYYKGECLKRPAKKEKRLALDYLQKAAAAGNIDACYEMWLLFENGNDLLVSEQDAVAFLKKAADNGNIDAMNDLGELYCTARIVEKNGQLGVDLIKKAAGEGCFSAQMRTFHMWFDGRYYDILVDFDKKKAWQLLLSYAQESGNPQAQTMLWETYLDKNPVMLTRIEALGYLKKAADAHYTPAMFKLANLDLDGVYKDVDTEEGMELLKEGAKLGCADAQLALYELYYSGEYHALHRPVNKERAYKWITKSAVTNPQALYRTWEMFVHGNEMELETPDALEMLFISARMNCCDSLYTIAVLYAQGEYVPMDIEQAMKYLSLAAELGHPKSMFKLYEVHTGGKFENQPVEQDERRANRMLLLSAQLGYVPACKEVCKVFAASNSIGVDNTFVKECRLKIPADQQDGIPSAPAAQDVKAPQPSAKAFDEEDDFDEDEPPKGKAPVHGAPVKAGEGKRAQAAGKEEKAPAGE